MKTIKSFTSLEQSKKLAEFLPIESADMYYMETSCSSYTVGVLQRVERNMLLKQAEYYKMFPCWSLAALLGVLPYPFLSELSNGIWKCGCYPSGICNYVTADSPIDACYEMIIKLNELNLI